MPKPVTNHELDALLADAGYSQTQAAFARQVNAHSRTTRGAELQYDGASVYWWLRGRTPDDPAPAVIAEVLSRRLNRTVTANDLGFRRGGTDLTRLGLVYEPSLEDSRTTVADLWRYLLLRRDVLTAAPLVVGATMTAGWAWLFDPRDPDTSHTGARRVTAGDVAALHASQRQILDLDRRHGGGHARALMVGWLHREVTPMLHGTYTDAVGRQLLAAVAELTGQVGFMSYDVGEHGLAQRYFIQALRLAKAGDDPAFGAHVLANMATQAVYLNQPAEAVRLARAAVEGARRAHPAVMARLYTAEACAHAIAADEASCSTALRNAEKAMGKTAGDGPAWAGYFTPAHFAGTAMRCWRDLGKPDRALRHAADALQIDAGGTRTKALHTALAATVHATGPNPDVEQAAALGAEALDLADAVRSRRVVERVDELGRLLRPYRRNRAVAGFLGRSAQLAKAA
ncbi:XRE family transcriptional regulator [Dactylosporangium sp. NPDC051484]|uniref:XRE family transcriptional regulator n=1 Tax=Dactylosporangium sp. NPDC051484 TaxID=3154942 RepID=UPI003450E8E2